MEIRSLGNIAPLQTHQTQIKPAAKAEEKPQMQGDSVEMNLSRGTAAAASPEKVKIKVLPHDPQVAKPEIIEFSKDKIGSKIAGPKMALIDAANPKAIPDLEGNYIYDVGTPQFDQMNAYTVSYRTYDMLEGLRGTPVKWAFRSDQLGVNPHKREGMNAYYSRGESSVNFFYFNSPALGKTVQTSQSSDIVSHEVGHAVLDGMKPGYLGWDTETMSVHEAFADTTAMLFTLKDQSNVEKALQSNLGDQNLICMVGEEFGKALVLSDKDPSNDHKTYIRTTLNEYKYVDPSTLPDKADRDSLANESHSFSRILSGANYDLLTGIYEANMAQGMSRDKALTEAGDTLGKLLLKSIDLAPASRCKYKDVALGMLKADGMQNHGKNSELLKSVFMERNIISEKDVKSLEDHMEVLNTISVQMTGGDFSAKGAEKIINRFSEQMNLPEDLTLALARVEENENGGKTMTFEYGEEMLLAGDKFGKYENHYVDLKGSLVMTLDQSGKLMDFNFDEINEQKKKDTERGVLDAISKGLVTEKAEEGPFTAQVVTDAQGKKKLERLPIIIM